jgi:hypothetical protein
MKELSLKPMICSPNNDPQLFQYLCQRTTQKTVEKFSDGIIKGFKIEPVLTENIEDVDKSS